MRRIGVLMCGAESDPVQPGSARGVPGRATAIGLDRRPQRADRHSLACGRCGPQSHIRGRIGWTCAGRHSGHFQRERGGAAAGKPQRADRVRECHRSGRRRLRREPGAAGRQRHRVHRVRIRHQREMAGATQRDRAPHDARGGPSGSRTRRRYRPVRSDPVQ